MSIITKALIITAVIYGIVWIFSLILNMRYYMHLYKTVSEDEYDAFCNQPSDTKTKAVQEWYRSGEGL